MLQETNLEMALKKVLAGKRVLAAMKYNEKKKLYETIRG